MKASVVIPCFNEEATILELLEAVRAVDIPKEVIVVDDGSTDGTHKLLANNPALWDTLVTHESNRGKGAALRSGFERVSGEVVIIQDADLEYEPSQYPKLLAPIQDGLADVVYGSRFVGGDVKRVLYFWHTLGNRVLTLASNMFTNLNLTDMETCFKVFRSDLIPLLDIQEKRFGVEPELTAKFARIPGLRIYEVGISYFGRTYAEGKKIGWRDGVGALRCIVRYNMTGGRTRQH
jgi:glycosyltransferase involved in cell wall biosynthesis